MCLIEVFSKLWWKRGGKSLFCLMIMLILLCRVILQLPVKIKQKMTKTWLQLNNSCKFQPPKNCLTSKCYVRTTIKCLTLSHLWEGKSMLLICIRVKILKYLKLLVYKCQAVACSAKVKLATRAHRKH